MGTIDTGLDFYRTVLALRGFRQELLSADIANASTPHFKAVDLDFREALAELVADNPAAAPAAGGMVMLVDDDRQFGGPSDNNSIAARRASGAVKYQIGGRVTLDGNSVDLDTEKRAAAQNAIQYEAVADFTSQTVNMLMTAIKGSNSGGTSGA
ncbi:MAG: flagellar basal body rod protein FlgB [Stellaceae bacterium]